MKRSLFVVGILVLLSVGSLAQSGTEKSVAFTIAAGDYLASPINVVESSFRYTCRFRAQGGSRNDIEIYIMDAENFENWRNGNSADTYYNSGRKTVGHWDLTLKKGSYVQVFNNRWALVTPKAVTLTCTEHSYK